MLKSKKEEFALFYRIKKEKSTFDELVFFKNETMLKIVEKKLIALINNVNEFENIGDIETIEDINENSRFLNWFNKLDKTADEIIIF